MKTAHNAFAFAILYLSVLGLTALGTGCGSDTGGSGWDINDDASFDAASQFTPDSHRDDEADAGGGPDPAGACSDLEAGTAYIDGTRSSYGAWQLQVMDERLFFHQRSQPEHGESSEREVHPSSIFMLNVESSITTQITPPGRSDMLIGAEDGRVLVQQRDSQLGGSEVFGVYSKTGQILQTFETPEGYGRLSHGTYKKQGAPRKFFDGARLLLQGLDNEPLLFSTEGSILARGEESVWDHHLRSRPVLTKDGFAYSAARASLEQTGPNIAYEPAEVFTVTPAGGVQQLTNTPEDERYVFADGRELYWSTEAAVYQQKDGRQVRIHEGRCGPPHAVNGRAAFACAAHDDDEQRYGEPILSQLFLYDGTSTREIMTGRTTGMIHAVRLSEAGVAWVEFDDPEATCHGTGLGRVMYHDIDSETQFELGEVFAPCWCCEEYWPQLVVENVNGVVVWNYARRSPQQPSDSHVFAYAKITCRQSMEPVKLEPSAQ